MIDARYLFAAIASAGHLYLLLMPIDFICLLPEHFTADDLCLRFIAAL
jgi:hypothetical protein